MSLECDLVGLGLVLKDMYQHMKSVAKGLKEVAARASRDDHSKRPKVADVRALLQRLVREPQTPAFAPVPSRKNKRRNR